MKPDAEHPKPFPWRGLHRTMLGWFLLISLVPTALIGVITYLRSRDTLLETAGETLTNVATLRARKIESHFDTRLLQLATEASNPGNVATLTALRESWLRSSLPLEAYVRSYPWAATVLKHADHLRVFLETADLDNILLLDKDGNVLFTAAPSDRLGTNVYLEPRKSGYLRNACLQAFRSGKSAFSDFEWESGFVESEAVGYLVEPMLDNQDQKIGMMVFCLSVSSVNGILNDRTGLGETEETYLVGQDLRLRSIADSPRRRLYPGTELKTESLVYWRGDAGSAAAIAGPDAGADQAADTTLISSLNFDTPRAGSLLDSISGFPANVVSGAAAQWVEREYGKALLLDGAQCLEAPFDPKPTIESGQITVSLWVCPADQQGRQENTLVELPGMWRMSFRSDTRNFRFLFMERNALFNRSFDLNTWHHLVGVFDGSTVWMYVDGGMGMRIDYAPGHIRSDQRRLWIGMTHAMAESGFAGKIDDIRIYSRALDPIEVNRLYVGSGKAIAPVIETGDYQSLTFPFNSTTLWGRVHYQLEADNRRPPVQWTQLEGPDKVEFVNPQSCTTKATFPVPGAYLLQLSARSGDLFSTAGMTVVVRPPGESGLVSHWKLDETSGTVAIDAAGLSNGEIAGIPRWVEGRVGGAFQFDGKNAIVVPRPWIYDFGKSMSVAAWVRETGAQAYNARFISKGDSVWRMTMSKLDPRARFVVNNYSLRTSSSLDDDRWYHLVAVYGPLTGMRFYVDGVLDSIGPYVGASSRSPWPLMFGSDPERENVQLAGTMDDIRMYDRPLTVEEVRALAALGWVSDVEGEPGQPSMPWVETDPPPSFARATATTGDQDAVESPSGGTPTSSTLASAQAVSPEAIALDYGLAHHWKMDGNYIDGKQAAEVMTSGVLLAENGRIGGGAVFGRSGGLMQFGPDTGATERLSVAFWMRADITGSMRLFDKQPLDDSGRGWAIDLNSDSTLTFSVGSANRRRRVDVSTAYDTNIWVYIICTFEDGVARMYVNGDEAGYLSNIETAAADNSQPLRIGSPGDPKLANRFYRGMLDDVRIYSRVIEEWEAEQLATENLAPPAEKRRDQPWSIRQVTDLAGRPVPPRVYIGPRGEKVIGVVHPLIVGGLAMAVVAEKEVAAALALADNVRLFLQVCLAAVGFIVFLLALYLTRRIVEPIRQLTTATQVVAEGTLDHEVPVRTENEIGELAFRFNDMVTKLRDAVRTNQSQYQIKTAQAELVEKLRGDRETLSIALEVIGFFRRSFLTSINVLFVCDRDGALQLAAEDGAAEEARRAAAAEIAAQTAARGRVVLIGDEDPLADRLARSDSPIKFIYSAPIYYESRLRAVLILGAPTPFSDYEREFLVQTLESIGSAIATAESRARVNELLERTQQQARELLDHQQRLSANETRLRQVFEGIQEGLIIHDLDGKILDCNNVVCRRLGYTRGQLTKMRMKNIQAPEAAEPYAEKLHEITDRRGMTIEDIHETSSGERIIVEVSLSYMDYEGGRAILAAAREVTERKREEEHRRELERQVEQMQRMESLGALAGGVAHDFNNLLMAILGNAEMALLDLAPDMKAGQSIHAIVAAANRATDLSRQMLAYSGKGRFVVEQVNVNAVLDDMQQLMEASISKKVSISRNQDPTLPLIDADPTQLRQLIMSLVVNAAEAIGDQCGLITIRTGQRACNALYFRDGHVGETPAEGQYVYIDVNDTGCGMDAQTRDRIFEPFFTTKFTGRGLGLASALGIVRGHKGAIKVLSEVNKGTTVRVLFPAGSTSAPLQVSRHSQGGGTWTPSGTILLVDDEQNVRAIAARMIEHIGFKVMTACDGRDALQLFKKHSDEICCVLLDLTMPDMSGDETLVRLKMIRDDVPMVLTSGYSEADIATRHDVHAFSGFIQKPYQLHMLQAQLRTVLETRIDRTAAN